MLAGYRDAPTSNQSPSSARSYGRALDAIPCLLVARQRPTRGLWDGNVRTFDLAHLHQQAVVPNASYRPIRRPPLGGRDHPYLVGDQHHGAVRDQRADLPVGELHPVHGSRQRHRSPLVLGLLGGVDHRRASRKPLAACDGDFRYCTQALSLAGQDQLAQALFRALAGVWSMEFRCPRRLDEAYVWLQPGLLGFHRVGDAVFCPLDSGHCWCRRAFMLFDGCSKVGRKAPFSLK